MNQPPEPRKPPTDTWNLELQGSCAEITHQGDRDLVVRLLCSGKWRTVGVEMEVDVTPQDFRALADAMDTANEHSAAVVAKANASQPTDEIEVTR